MTVRDFMFRRLAAAPLFTAAALAAACAGPEDAALTDESVVTDQTEAIQGGQIENGYPAVGGIDIDRRGGCSGTLISPSVVLTAKHCGGTTLTFYTGTNGSNFVAHAVDRQMPYANGNLLILHLTTPIRDIRPMDINTAQLPYVGQDCTEVGFGIHAEPNGTNSSWVKRSAVERVESADGSLVGTVWGTGIGDYGDSGGPLVCDGRIAGVASFKQDGDGTGHVRLKFATTAAQWVTNMTMDYSSEPMVANVSWGVNRLDQFVRGADGAVYHKWWSGWQWGPSVTDYEYMGGFTTGTPEAVSWGENRINLFVRGGDHALYHKAWDGFAWYPSVTDWEYLGGVLVSHPSVVSWGPNRLDIFGVGSDGGLYHKAWDGSAWYPSALGWEALGGEFQGPIKAVSWGAGRLDVFGLGMDHALYHKAWEGGRWYPSQLDYDYLGGGILGAPEVVSWGPGRLDIFVKGTDNALYHKAWENGWYPSQYDYEYLGGGILGSPTAVSWGPGRLDIFAEGTDTGLYHKAWQNGWYPSQTDWEAQGGGLSGSPTVVSWGFNRLDVFVAGSNFALFHKAWDGRRWFDYDYLGGILSW